MAHIVVIGAGQAGSSLVCKLRNLGFDGDITLIGDEPVIPYQRPPLSKKYLLGEMELERLYLRPRSFYDDQSITVRTNERVQSIETSAKTLTTDQGTISYDQLAITTGSVPRLLPAKIGGDLGGVFTVRTLSDVDAMQAAFEKGGKCLIIGGGYIGLEAAAVAAKRGIEVTLVEMADRILGRVASVETANFFRDLHTAHGVRILEGVGLDRLTGTGDVGGAVLANGETLDIDFAVVGVGIAPDTALAEAAGITLNNGIETDAQGRTSAADVWAAGDCASFLFQGERIRLESVPNAIDQAEVVAENMVGAGKDYVATPWFWSDQYDVKLQIAGLNTGYNQVVVRKGEGTLSHWYYKAGQLIAVDAMNDPRGYMVAKRLIEAGKNVDPAAAGDPDTDLKALMRG